MFIYSSSQDTLRRGRHGVAGESEAHHWREEAGLVSHLCPTHYSSFDVQHRMSSYLYSLSIHRTAVLAMVACGTLKGQYSLDNSHKPLTQWPRAQGKMVEPAEVDIEAQLLQKTWSKNWPSRDHWHCTVWWMEGISSASGSVLDCSQERPARTFFPVHYEIPDIMLLIIWFHSHNKESEYWHGQDDGNHGLIFTFQT